MVAWFTVVLDNMTTVSFVPPLSSLKREGNNKETTSLVYRVSSWGEPHAIRVTTLWLKQPAKCYSELCT